MSVIRGERAEPAPSPPPSPPLTLYQASAFLRDQADCLCQGLEHADDATVVRAVLHAHEERHESWLALISAADAVAGVAAEELARLYAFHGRIAGALERRGASLASPVADRQVRTLLRARLRTRTDEALRALRAAGVTAAGETGGA